MLSYREARNIGDLIYNNYIEPNLPTLQQVISGLDHADTSNLRQTGGGNDEEQLQDIIARAVGLMYCLEEGDEGYSRGLSRSDEDFVLYD